MGTSPRWADKLDARGRRQVYAGALAGPLELLLALDCPLTARQRAAITAAGLDIRSSTGRVVSGQVADVDTLAEVLGLPFIRRAELSRHLDRE